MNIEKDFEEFSDQQVPTSKQLNYLMGLLFKFNGGMDLYNTLDKVPETIKPTFLEFFEKIETETDPNKIKISFKKMHDMISLLKTYCETKSVKDPKKMLLENYVPIRNVKEIIKYNTNYEIGIQYTNNNTVMKYIKFYNLMMLDIDSKNYDSKNYDSKNYDSKNYDSKNYDSKNYDSKNYDIIKKNIDSLNDEIYKQIQEQLRFKIYKTRNGYHLFVTSHKLEYNAKISLDIAKYLGCDDWYILYFKNHGYCVRLSKKDENETFIQQYVEDYGGQKEKEMPELLELLAIMENS
jgi:hypothetical protein